MDEQTKLERAAGRFGPGRQFFLCKTEEEVKALEELGFVSNPADLAEPYASEEATHIGLIENLVFDAPVESVEKALEKSEKKGKKKGKKKHAEDEQEQQPKGNRLAT